MCVLSIKVPIRKKSGNFFNNPHSFGIKQPIKVGYLMPSVYKQRNQIKPKLFKNFIILIKKIVLALAKLGGYTLAQTNKKLDLDMDTMTQRARLRWLFMTLQ